MGSPITSYTFKIADHFLVDCVRGRMAYVCSICGGFSRISNMELFVNNVHGLSKPPSTGVLVSHTVLRHPFTCIVAGCTQSGKTVWVKKLLENAHLTIQPPPQRIIWCYGQWEPLYFEYLNRYLGLNFMKAFQTILKSPDFWTSLNEI